MARKTTKGTRRALVEDGPMEGIAWRWQSIDAATLKAPLAQEGVGKKPTDRGKKLEQRHLLVDGRGAPLSRIVTGANQHDVTQLEAVLANIMAKRKNALLRRTQHLCADAGWSK
jgi:putative transposase